MASSSPPKRPNFLIVVADDLGYSDTGPFGGEIQTPSLDKLAKDGIRLTNFHTASACSPTRAMLFSGTDNHIAGVGQMAEHMHEVNVDWSKHPGYEGYLNHRVAALSEILQDNGYHTMMSGKWHLGLRADISPHARGFDRVFGYLSSSHNHYNFEPQLDNPDHAIFKPMNSGKFWMRDDKFIDRKKDLPDDFYSSRSFTDELLNMLENRPSDKPFFAYLPFTAPHWPLQAPKEAVEKYKGMYDDGPHALREKRLNQLIKLGLVSADVEPAPLESGGEDWDDMTPEQKKASAKKMEVFAGMVDVMDENIGRVLDYLEEKNELDDTFVLFMSDNGAEGALLEAVPIMGGESSVNKIIDRYYDNSIENMGNGDSYIWYGPSWACASMAPSRGFKIWITEGAIRCPAIVRYPKFAEGQKDKFTESFCTVMDVLPTVLDLAGIPPVGNTFRGRQVALPRGSSWVPHLSSVAPSFHDEDHQITGWELFGLRAIREGDWKALWMLPPKGKNRWELYNLKTDPGEIHDLYEKEPEVLKRLIDHWETYYTETGMFELKEEFLLTKYSFGK